MKRTSLRAEKEFGLIVGGVLTLLSFWNQLFARRQIATGSENGDGYLVLETCVLVKKNQPAFADTTDWQKQFKLD